MRGSGIWIDQCIADFYGWHYTEITGERMVFVADIYLPVNFGKVEP